MNYKKTDIERYFKSPDKNLRSVLIFGLQMDEVEKDVSLLFSEYNAASLMGGRRVVIIKDVNNNLTKPLKELFENTSSDSLLVMTSSTLNTKSSLVSYVKDASFSALISCYDDRQEDILSYVRNFFIAQNITISSDAFALLCHRLSADRKASNGELEKLITYIGSKKNITLEDVQKSVSDTAGSSFEDVCYFAATGDTQSALKAYDFLLNEGEEPVQILRQMTYHFIKLLECVAKMEKGTTLTHVVGNYEEYGCYGWHRNQSGIRHEDYKYKYEYY